MTDKLVFIVFPYVGDSGEYAHVEFRFYDQTYSESLGNEILTLCWQADKQMNSWYGLHWQVEANYPEDLQKAFRIANRLINRAKNLADSDYPDFTPILLYTAATMFATEVVSDRRLGEWVAIDKVHLEDSLVAFSEDWHTAGIGGYHYKVLLPDSSQDSTVQALLFNRLSEKREFDALEKWVLAGKPIKRWSVCEAPDVRPLADRLAEFELWRRFK